MRNAFRACLYLMMLVSFGIGLIGGELGSNQDPALSIGLGRLRAWLSAVRTQVEANPLHKDLWVSAFEADNLK
jgi:hypothetical protein